MEKLELTYYNTKEGLFTQTGNVRGWWIIMMNDAIVLFFWGKISSRKKGEIGKNETVTFVLVPNTLQ